MNPFYKQPVLIFGLIVPLVVFAVLFGVGVRYRGNLEDTFGERKKNYSQYKKVEAEREALEAKIKKQEPHMKRWMALFEKPTGSSVNGFLTKVQKQFKGQEFQQTAFRRTNSAGGLGMASDQRSIQIQLSFRGTYRALHNAFLEMETRMPHLQLDSIKLSVHPNNRVLNANVTYTAWQKE